MPTSRPSSKRSRPTLPGGLAETRKSVRRRGGLMALAVSAAVFVVGRVIGWIVGGAVGGAISFLSSAMALPVLAVFGMPAAGGTSRLLLVVVVSGVGWWIVGQVVAGRVTRKPIAGWREWSREFAVVGAGIWGGAAGGILLGALTLGAL